MQAKALYLSASLFTAAEQAFNRDLAAALRSVGYTVFLPQEIDQAQDQRKIFDLNVQELTACDLILAIADGPDVDSGVAWEMGYACVLGKPVVALRTDFLQSGEVKGVGVNLMLYYGAMVYAGEQNGSIEVVEKKVLDEDRDLPNQTTRLTR